VSGVPRSHNTNPAELFEGRGFAWTMVATGAKQFEAVCRGQTGSSLNTVCCGAMAANSASDDCGVAPK